MNPENNHINLSNQPHSIDFSTELAYEFASLQKKVTKGIQAKAYKNKDESQLFEIYQSWFAGKFWNMANGESDAVNRVEENHNFCASFEEDVDNLLAFIKGYLNAGKATTEEVELHINDHFAQLEDIYFDTSALEPYVLSSITTYGQLLSDVVDAGRQLADSAGQKEALNVQMGNLLALSQQEYHKLESNDSKRNYIECYNEHITKVFEYTIAQRGNVGAQSGLTECSTPYTEEAFSFWAQFKLEDQVAEVISLLHQGENIVDEDLRKICQLHSSLHNLLTISLK